MNTYPIAALKTSKDVGVGAQVHRGRDRRSRPEDLDRSRFRQTLTFAWPGSRAGPENGWGGATLTCSWTRSGECARVSRRRPDRSRRACLCSRTFSMARIRPRSPSGRSTTTESVPGCEHRRQQRSVSTNAIDHQLAIAEIVSRLHGFDHQTAHWWVSHESVFASRDGLTLVESLSAAAIKKFVVAHAFKLDSRHGDLIRSTVLTRTGR